MSVPINILGFNAIQEEVLDQAVVTKVYIAFDNTPEGNQEAKKVSDALFMTGIECKHVRLPLGHDVNSLFMQSPHAKARFERYLSEAGCFDVQVEIVESIQNRIESYLAECESFKQSNRTITTKRSHLNQFLFYCLQRDMLDVSQVTLSVLEDYQSDLMQQENSFTGEVISETTQRERVEEVVRWLSYLRKLKLIDSSFEVRKQRTLQ